MSTSFLILFLCIVAATASSRRETQVNTLDTEWSLTYTGRHYDGSHTTFSYQVVADDGTGDEDLARLIIGVPNCLEVSVSYTEPLGDAVRDSNTGVEGYEWTNQAAGTTKSYSVQVTGNIASGAVSYLFYGSDRYAKGTTQGPSCSVKSTLSCDAGSGYQGQCVGHTARIALDGSASANAVQYDWSSSSGYFSGVTSATPTLTVLPPLCNEHFQVSLHVTDADGNDDVCTTSVEVHDDEAPTFVGLYVSDVTVECDDIPSPVHVTAKDNCDTNVKVNYNEIKTNHPATETSNGYYTLKRTWSSSDSCGNVVDDSHIITVIDATRPTIIGVGADESVSCDSVPSPCEVDATDNCDNDLSVSFTQSRQDGYCSNNYTIFRYWSVTDSTGNPAHKRQEIEVSDFTPPTLIGLPEKNIQVQCGEIPEAPVVTAVDDCDTRMLVVFSEDQTPGLSDNDYTLTRTWTATDDCDNAASFTQTIIVRDRTAPVLVGVPEDVDVDPQHIPGDCSVEVIDNCDDTITLDYVVVTTDGTCPFSYTLTRTWTATDVSGNEVEAVSIVTVSDTDAPQFSGLPSYDLTVECDNIPVSEVTAFDLSDGEVEVQFTETKSHIGSDTDYTLTRQWFVVDSCGNENSHSQIITVVDTTHPILINTPPARVTVSCDAVPAAADVSVTDNCDEFCTDSSDVVYSEELIPGSCDSSYTLTRSWSASDCSGLSASSRQVITVQDITSPVLVGLPNDVDASCDDVPAVAHVSVSDNCDEPSVSSSESRVDGDSTYNYALYRTWTATDECGNHVSHTQTVSVSDDEAPTLTGVPADITAECDAVPDIDTVWAQDNCETSVHVTDVETRVDGDCSDDFSFKRVWTATDEAGNVVSATQWVSVQDTTDPVLWDTPETPVVAEAGDIPAKAAVYATDNCDADVEEKLQYSETRTDGATPQDYILTRKWWVSDNCGNSHDFTQVIEVYDTTDPLLGPLPPSEVIASCDDIPAPFDVGVSDQDETVVVQYSQVESDWDCLHTYTITRFWHATDVSGNRATYTQTIFVEDTQSPEWDSIPAPVSVPCTDPPAWPTDVTAWDLCHDVEDLTIQTSETRESETENDYTLTRVWHAVDTCGNEKTESQTIEVYDRVAPQLVNVPADDTADCDRVPDVPSVTVTDNCDDTVVVNFDERRVDGSCPFEYTLLRTWSVADVSGNQASETQTLTVIDQGSPTLHNLPPAIVYAPCHSIPEPADVFARDYCSDTLDMPMDYSTVITAGKSSNDYTITRTWATSDECGNTVTFDQNVHVYDDQSPVLHGTEEDETNECDNVVGKATVTVTDNCDAAIEEALEYTEEKHWVHSAQEVNEYTLTRTWSVSDVSGNTVSHVQVITVEDTFKPTFVHAPPEDTVDEACNVSEQPEVTCEDNCDSECEVHFDEVTNDTENAQEYSIDRTWTTTDTTGNERSHTQYITVTDTTNPDLVGLPEETVTYECNAIRPPASVTAEDCDSHINVEYFEYEKKGSRTCDFGYQNQRVWDAYDDSGNWAGFVQTVTIQDTSSPMLQGIPGDITYECDNVVPPPTVTATDNCDEVLVVSYSEEPVYSNPSEYIATRSWHVTDNCGNSDSGSQTVTVTDNTEPELFVSADDLTTSHHILPMPAKAAAMDNCAEIPTISLVEERTDGSCEYGYTLARTWTATDDAGLTSSQLQIITVEDNVKPVLSNYPSDETVEVSNVPSALILTATDENPEPGTPVDVVFSETRIDGSNDNTYTLLRSWTATDACGNVESHTKTIEVIDTTDPVLEGVPIDRIVQCDDIPDPADVSYAVEHSADDGTTIEYLHERVHGSCDNEYAIQRTWIATDEAGNTATGIQVITVEDTIYPLFDTPFPSPSLEFDTCHVEAAPIMTGTDNCVTTDTTKEYGQKHGAVSVAFDEVRTDGLNENEYTLTRTWTVTDACGQFRVNEQTVVVTDETDPEWTTQEPRDATVECDSIPQVSVMSATDCTNTAVTVVENVYKDNYNCNNEWTETREWIASDLSGNSIMHTQVVTVIDTTAPVLHGVPSNHVVECDTVPEVASVTATDNCDESPHVTYSEVRSGGEFDDYTLTRTWTATDDCGNSYSETQIINVVDTSMPSLDNTPHDITVECTDGLHVPSVQGSDNCDTSVEVSYSERRVDGRGCDQTYALIRTWVAHDNEGNTHSESQTITVQDTTAPDFDGTEFGLEQLTVSCSKVPPYAPWVEAWDNCGEVTLTRETHRIDGPTDTTYTLHYIYTATDECGNANVFTSVLNVHDISAPWFDEVPADSTEECSEVPPRGHPTYFDACTEEIKEVYDELRRDGACNDQYYLDRTWTITDLDGNEAHHTQSLSIQDTTSPEFSNLPESSSVIDECDDVRVAPHVTASDNCDTVDVKYSETRSESLSGVNTEHDYTLTRTWTVADDCGNNDDFTQTVQVEDSTLPDWIIFPDDSTVECDRVPEPFDVEALDNCSEETDISIQLTEQDSLFDCTNTYIKTRKWCATDISGNSRCDTQTLTVQDTTAPVWAASGAGSPPADVTLECSDDLSPPTLIAHDNCATSTEVTVTLFESSDRETSDSSFTDSDYTITRTWTATDNCGNAHTHTQTVTVQDTTFPILENVPADVALECSEPKTTDTVTINENCDFNIEKVYHEELTPGSCDHTFTLTRTWSAEDVSGNFVEADQVIDYTDTTPPFFYGLPKADHVVAECDAVPVASELYDVGAFDDCDENPSTSLNVVSTQGTYENNRRGSDGPNDYTITNTWTTVDNCGNTDAFSQIVSVWDTTKPRLENCPADLTVEISAIPDPVSVTATDNCDETIAVSLEETRTDGSCPHFFELDRTWQACDVSGNCKSCTQIVTVIDTTAPSLWDTPEDAWVECDQVPDAAYVYATDNSGDEIEVEYSETRVDGESEFQYTLSRRWEASDACGNSHAFTQIITVLDSSAPMLTGYEGGDLPEEMYVSVEYVPIVYEGEVMAHDNCDTDSTVHFSEERLDGDCTHTYTLIRSWSSTDQAGNEATHTQLIEAHDYTAPVLHGVPNDVTVEYPQVPAMATVAATDNSNGIIHENHSEQRVDGESTYEYQVHRRWSFTDECGNEAFGTQIITVIDTTPPDLSSGDSSHNTDMTVECDQIPAACTVTAVDNGEPVEVRFSESNQGDVGSGEYFIIREWTATDLAGNLASHTQTVTVLDNTSPVFSREPASVEVECDCETFPAAVHISVTDNCDASVVVNFAETRVSGTSDDTYSLIRTWTASDSAGNSVEHQQTITVHDTQGPVFSQLPQDAFYSCTEFLPTPEVFAADNCDGTVVVSASEVRTDSHCDATYSLERSWSVTDRSGNHATHTQMVHVEDGGAPDYYPSALTCIYPPNDQFAVFASASTTLLDINDECSSFDVSFTACNNTESDLDTFDGDCYYDADQDSLYVRASQNSPHGRTYTLYATIVDDCGNQRDVTKDFWVPVTQFESSQMGLECVTPSAIGTDNGVTGFDFIALNESP